MSRSIRICDQYKNIFTNMLDSISDAFCYIDKDWRLIFINPAASKFLMLPEDQLLNQNVWTVFNKNFSLGFQERIIKVAKEKTPLQFEEYYLPLSNWYEVRVYPCQYGLAVYFNDITERKKTEEQIRHMAYHDPLTNIPNRMLFKDRLNTALARAKRNNEMVALMFLDLDKFKIINDTLGHDVGDRVLQNVAKRLISCLREGDTVARMGGDEFIILLPNIENKDNVTLVADRIVETMQQPFIFNEQGFYVTTSIGISVYPNDSEKSCELLKKADSAMYSAKKVGRNNFKFYK